MRGGVSGLAFPQSAPGERGTGALLLSQLPRPVILLRVSPLGLDLGQGGIQGSLTDRAAYNLPRHPGDLQLLEGRKTHPD